MSGMGIAYDPVTIFLLCSLVLLVGVPIIFIIAWKVTKPPLRAGSLRLIYLSWALLLGASSVWSLSRDVNTSVEGAGIDNFVRLGFLALGALVILFVGAKYRFVFMAELSAGVLGIFFVFSLWGVASTLWSVLPASTLYKSFEYCIMLSLFALTASSIQLATRDPRGRLIALKSVFDWNWFLVFMLLVSVYMGVIIFPEYAIMQDIGTLGFSISGALPGISANGVGQLAAILGVVALVRILHQPGSKKIYVPVLGMCLVTMMLTQSRSPILGFLLAVAVVLVASRRFGLFAIAAASIGAVLLSAPGQMVYDFMRREQVDSNIETLSGRVVYWEASLEAVRESWLTGYGATAGGKYVLASLGEEASTVHSMFIETLLDTGVVGLALLLLGLGAVWFYLLKFRSYAMSNPVGRLLWFECLGVMVILSLRSVFTITVVWTPAVLIFGLVLVFISIVRRQVVRETYAGSAGTQPVPATRWRRSSIRG